MLSRYKLISTALLTILTIVSAVGQKRTYSPYSRYGLGELQSGGFGRNAAMGGTGIALQSSANLNNLNPASYSGMDSISFFFEGGVVGFNQKLTTAGGTSQFSDMNFSYFAIGFPMAKWGFFSMGIQPASVVGYEFFDDNDFASNSGDYSIYNASGEGNTTKAYAGIALSPIKNLSVGMHFSYLFGSVKHHSLVQFPNDFYALKLMTSQNTHINDVFFDFGAQYTIELNERHSLTLGAVYNPKTGINGTVTKIVGQGTTLEQSGRTIIIGDTLHFSENKLSSNSFEMAEKIGFGVAYSIKDMFTASADYTIVKWSEAKFPDAYTVTTDMEQWAVGFEYIPNERSATFYPSRIRYRLGSYYKKDYLVVKGHQLEDFGISFGVGLPLKRSKTSINLAAEWGQKGTTNDNLVKENYTRFTLNLTLQENWFRKSKFD